MDNKIDFVMIWVDGSDEEWRKEKNKYAGLPDDEINGEIRFRDWDNLKYWFRGVEKFAPWVNNVYFVTCGHYPKWLNLDCPKLKFIKHEDYIPKEYLPTFSSHTIEINLHRIKGLSEKFVYFNDDIFLISPVESEDFFKKDLPKRKVDETILPGLDNLMSHVYLNNSFIINKHFKKREILKKYGSKYFSLKSGCKSFLKKLCLLPFDRFTAFNDPHIASPMTKSTLEEVWRKEHELLDKVSKDKFRQIDGVNQYLFKMWDICKGTYEPSGFEKCKYEALTNENLENVIKEIKTQKFKQLCLNDMDNNIDFDKAKEEINKAFESILSEKSSFEI